MAPVSYGDVLARNLRAARSRLDINQEMLASRMRTLGYSSWLRQTVANVEKGGRRVTAEEIFGLAYALETSIGALMRATDDDKLVSFPSGEPVTAASVQRSTAGRNDDSIWWREDEALFAGPGLQYLSAEEFEILAGKRNSTGEWAPQSPEDRAEPDDEERSP